MKPVLLALLAALAWSAPASAAIRHAAPDGAGTECSSVAPCSLETALTGAVKDDEVALGAGEFPGGTSFISAPKDVQLHGAPGGRTVVAFGPGGALGLYGPASRVRDLRFTGQALGKAGMFSLVNGGVAERVEVRTTGTNATACFARDAVFVDVVCAASGPGARALNVYQNNAIVKTAATTLRNTTLVARGTGSRALDLTSIDGMATKLTLHNTIARAQGVDVRLETDSMPGSSITFGSSHSNYVSMTVAGAGISHSDGGTRQLAAPVFAAPAELDMRPDPSSPTVDAGADDALNGEQDLTGQPRRMGMATDIGAVELAPPPHAATRAPELLDPARARLSAEAAGFGAPTTTTFLVTAEGLPARSVPADAEGADGERVAILDGLLPGRSYVVRAHVTTLGGTATGAEHKLVVPSAPAPPGAPAKPTKPALKLRAPAAKRRGKRVEVRLTVPAAGKLRLVLRRSGCTRRCGVLTTSRTVKSGRVKLTLKPRRLPAGKLKLTVTLTASGATATATTTVR